MFQALLSLSRQTLVYGMGKVITRLIPFLILPVLTNYLSPEQFGIQILFYILIAIIMEVIRSGQDIALLRFYVPEQDLNRRKLIFSTVFWTSILFTSIIAFLLFNFPEFWVSLLINQPTQHPNWMLYIIKLVAGICWLDNMAAFPLTILRGESRSGRFLFATISGVTVQTILTIWFLIGLNRGVAAIFEANIIASLVVFLITLPTVFSRIRLAFDKTILVACLAFGLPNLPNSIFVQIIEFSDRKILELYRSASEVGIYSAGYKLGMFLSIIAMGFRLAWQPFFLRISNREDAKLIYGRVLTYFVVVICWFFLILTSIIQPLVRWQIPGIEKTLIPSEYWQGIDVFPVILLAHIFNGLYAVFMVGIYLKNKIFVLPWITAVAAVVNIGGNILLVPHYGMWASAWLTVVSYGLMTLLLYTYVQRVYPIIYEWGRVIHVFIIGGGIFAASVLLNKFDYTPIAFILGISFPIILILTGLLNFGERTKIKSIGTMIKSKFTS